MKPLVAVKTGETGLTASLSSARHFFVVNPSSFHNTRKMETVIAGIHHFFEDAAAQSDIKADYGVHTSRFPRDAIGSIRRFADAVPSGAPLRVYAVGGDSILFDCLNGVVELPNTELGTLPYGKENNFYRVFGQNDKEIFQVLDIQTRAPSVPIDVLYCGSNYALSYCLIGIESLINANAIRMRRSNDLLRRIIPPAFLTLYGDSDYTEGVMNREVLKQYYRMWVDNEELGGVHATINIANSPWYADSKTAMPEAIPTDGLLDVLVSGEISAITWLRIMGSYRRGHHAKYPHLFTYKRAKKIFVTSTSPLILDLDGEVFYDKYITVEIRPAAVRIINPLQAAGAGS